ncbi:L,D-transpeptidase [Jiella sp. MQZ9-1]|uniref:L,D-transpeptidase n=1 Tax=Jiella flava TaxID=2816857 RepID=A0A939FZK6_9HYPH|nr:L,D-transpeptidase [Jiella flava]MBO0663101.1 L,D-transpeptidase [Jiella flava]MCD2471520.1 L,D-transpeptidase [Jiella flava]
MHRFPAPARAGLVALFALGLAGCSTVSEMGQRALALTSFGPSDSRYGAFEDGGHAVPAIPDQYLDKSKVRRQIAYHGPEAPGTIVVDPAAHYLYLIQSGGTAMRYSVGVGKAGFAFSGRANIARKADWPRWTPTSNMLDREPQRFGPYASGLKGGLGNPLGARALYLYRGGRDTYYRIHGTNDPSSIGHSVSSGCIRMFNQDVVDLETRVPVGTKVVVKSNARIS